MHYDRSYDMDDMTPIVDTRAMTPNSFAINRCEGGDSNPQALRRQILSLKPSLPDSSSETGDFATRRRESSPIDGDGTTNRTTSHSERSVDIVAPTSTQLATLKLLAAGVELRPITEGRYQLVLVAAVLRMTRAKNVARLIDAGWVEFNAGRNRYLLTPLGRSRAAVSTFVRAFSEGV